MKLYEVPRYTWIKLLEPESGGPHRVPPDAPALENGQRIFFDHVDGMYSSCKNEDGDLVYLAAWTEVEVID